MKKVLIAYASRTGNTQKMAEFVAEGIRIVGKDVEIKKISEIKNEKPLEGYDAYVFGSPTYHRDMTQGMKTFLFLGQKLNMQGKIAGAFGSYTHSGDAPAIILDTMQFVFKMDIVDLGSFKLKEDVLATDTGARACQDYGRAIGEKLGD